MKHVAPITSRHNKSFKALCELAGSPGLDGNGIVDGIHLVRECLDRRVPLIRLVLSESGMANPEIQALIDRADAVERICFGDALFRDFVGIGSPTGIAAVFALPPIVHLPVDGDAILLDAIQDAGNVGTLMRTAAAAGISNVLLGPGCAGAWSLKVLRAAQGAHFSLRIVEHADLAAAVEAFNGDSIATVVRDGVDLYTLDLTGPSLWLFGNEGAGLSPVLAARATIRATLPMARATESLNVAAAAAACLFEARRQRRTTKRPA